MNLLAIETSTEQLSLAVLCGERLFVRDVDAGQQHSELTLPLLRELMAESGLAMHDLDAVAFGQGPGSFTGVRIACGLAQGMALGLGKPVLPVQTQMALAEQAGAAKVLVALDARMGEIYLAAYERSATEPSGWEASIAPCLCGPANLPALPGEGWVGLGSAFDSAALAGALDARFGAQMIAAGQGALPSAAGVVQIAARRVQRAGMGAAVQPAQAAPLYLRNKVALTIEERRLQKAQKLAESEA